MISRMKNFKNVIKKSALSPGEGTTVRVGKTNIALFNVGGVFFAVADACLHAGGPLGAGPLDGTIVTCPWHGWQFDVKKGCAVMSEDVRIPRYEVRVEGADVYVSKTPMEGEV
jgi:nitrite reductase (NADH) small subunit